MRVVSCSPLDYNRLNYYPKGAIFMSFFELNGMKLYFELRGNPEAKETILFLNGVMASTNSWYVLSKPFEELGYRVLLHDFKGQLKSDKPAGPYTFKEHADETAQLMDHLGIEKAHIVGTSYGGEVAMKLSMIHPEKVQSMVIIDSTSERTAVGGSFVSSWKAPALAGDGESFFNTLMPSIYGEKFIKENKDFLAKRAKATRTIGQEYLDGQVILYDSFLGDVALTEEELHSIKRPALIICGEEDILKTPEESLRIHHHIHGSEYVTLPECGHVSIFEKPKEVTTLLLGFILKNRS